MALPSRHRAAVRSRRKETTGELDKPAWYQHHELIAVASGAVLLVVIAVLSGWAHHSLSTARPVSPNTAAMPPVNISAMPLAPPPMRVQLRTWLTQAQPSINALVSARQEIAAAAANNDIVGTGAACQTADGAVATLQHQLPSPDPTLDSALQRAIKGYTLGVRYCISGVRNNDGDDIQQAATYIKQANADLQAAADILERDLPDSQASDPGVMTV